MWGNGPREDVALVPLGPPPPHTHREAQSLILGTSDQVLITH